MKNIKNFEQFLEGCCGGGSGDMIALEKPRMRKRKPIKKRRPVNRLK
jgi:hypothetical protein